MIGWAIRRRRVLIVVAHAVAVVLAGYLALALRFDGSVPPNYRDVFLIALPWILAVRLVTFQRFRLFSGLWRYTGLWDLRQIVLATAVSAGIIGLTLGLLPVQPRYPISVQLLDAILLICFVSAFRLTARLYREVDSGRRGPRVLVIGAGDAGAMIARELRNSIDGLGIAVGFIDDDPKKRGCSVDGIPVLGPRSKLAAIARSIRAEQVLIAIPSLAQQDLGSITASTVSLGLPVKILPSLETLLDRKSLMSRVRPLSVDDLLRRPKVVLDVGAAKGLLTGTRVLVTGAGGSIGAELCRQILALDPELLIGMDRYENGLFALDEDLKERSNSGTFRPVIGDITDAGRVRSLFELYAPDVIFHAAAHKHVPLMEDNLCEAVKNNVVGSRVLAERAIATGTKRFVLISSDKAINPTSIMGATKHVVEQMLRTIPVGDTIFAAVRFGNVLGSNGSVVPTFARQIAAGGPVTVTHPDMKRYFMLIPEAVNLVLNAATLATGGDTFVLEMGDQIKVVELAEAMIRLAGLRPNEDVDIVFTGLRPGEKLFEELVGTGESCEPTAAHGIQRVVSLAPIDPEQVTRMIRELEASAARGADLDIRRLLRELVPSYARPHNSSDPRLRDGQNRHRARIALENAGAVISPEGGVAR